MSTRRVATVAIAATLVLATMAGGYALGSSQAPNSSDADQEREAAYDLALDTSQETSFSSSRERGQDEGIEDGRQTGSSTGSRRGAGAGEAEAQAQLAAAAEAEAAAAREAALAETRERQENCGAPLFAKGYCPSDEEIAQESQAESLCGSGTAEGRAEAARQGIQC